MVTHVTANDNDDSGFGRTAGVFHTFHGTTNKQEKKIFARVINGTIPDVPQWLPWSEHDMLWGRKDHPGWIDLLARLLS
jgi:hypothetical protein